MEQPRGPRTMIERVARVLANEVHGNDDFYVQFVPRAKLVIAAMREPSAGMCKALGVFPDPPVKHDDPEKAIKLAPMLGMYHIWNGLIDAALSEDG
jgi:hypothetical protein